MIRSSAVPALRSANPANGIQIHVIALPTVAHADEDAIAVQAAGEIVYMGSPIAFGVEN